MGKKEAIRELSRQAYRPKSGLDWTVRRMQDEDAPGVARCYFEVYGESYPFGIYYMPERLLEENRRGNILSVVAVTEAGDVVGCGSVFRGSAYNSNVFELGQFVVLPEYRGTTVALEIQEHILDVVVPQERIDGIFKEAFSSNVVSQKMCAVGKLRETALEFGVVSEEAPSGEGAGAGRVPALMLFRTMRDKDREIHIPREYRAELEYILSALELKREIAPSQSSVPAGVSTRLLTQFLNFARMARFHFFGVGDDFQKTLETAETQARNRGVHVLQAYINLGEPWCGEAVAALRKKGWFFGGLLPLWFDADGLLMQKSAYPPDFDSINLYSERSHKILEFIRSDLQKNPACVPAGGPSAKSPKQKASGMSAGGPTAAAGGSGAVVISGEGLTIEEVGAVARHGASLSITADPVVLERVRSSSSFVQRAVETGEHIYGVNTGFGGMANISVAQTELAALQNNLIRFLKAGAGDYLPKEEVRAAMLLRANSHLRGYSGVRLELIQRLVSFLNHGVTPLVRELGSIGASGDLVPLASITGAVIGADPCFEVDFQGQKTDCITALGKMGMKPLTLEPKEGLAMVNGTSVMTGTAANCLYEVRRLTALSLGFHALAFQALKASNQGFHPLIHELKPHPGQLLCAELMLRLLKGSRMCRNELDGHHSSTGEQPIQDRYSLRCLPQYLGPILDGFRAAESAVEIEMNSVSDNPIIDGKDWVSYHGGNFLGQYVAVWMDHTRYYLGLMAKHIDTQIALLVAPEFNGGLPPSLVGNSGRAVNMGLKGLQICGNSIMPLLSFYGNSIADRYPTHAEQFNQNINSQGLNASVLARKSVRLMNSYIALALLFGVQAVELRAFVETGSYDPREALSPLCVPLYEAVRAELDLPPDAGRPLIRNDDEQSLEFYIQAISSNIASEGSIPESIREAVGI